MSDLKLVNISSGQEIVNIDKSLDEIYVVNNSKEININDNTTVYLIDKNKDTDVTVNIGENATVNYFIINSKNVNRTFNNKGILNTLEISLYETVESYTCNLLTVNAKVEAKSLSISDNHLSQFKFDVFHKEKETFSNIENVGLAMNGAKVTFDVSGKIYKGMSKSKCAQLSRGIIMDDNSKVTTKPILLIDEYDCFANHGATIGKISDDDLFYLMSRGLTKNDAFMLILEGVVRPYIDSIPEESMRNAMEKEVHELI